MTTHTYSILRVPRTVYAAVRALLGAEGLDEAIRTDTHTGEVLDLRGIALQADGASATPTNVAITVASLVSRRDGRGRVELQLNGEIVQLDLDKAREVVGMLQGAIEAAISDQLIVQFLTEKIGIDAERANAALIDFREMRQGSRDRVHPS
jgi:hypothetical protein